MVRDGKAASYKDANGFDGTNLNFENCSFKGTMHYFGQNGKTVFKNCEFNEDDNWIFYLNNIQPEYVFDGCTFNATNKGKIFNLYKSNSEYSEESGSSNYSNTCVVRISNCTFNGLGSNVNKKPIISVKLGDRANYQIYFNIDNNTFDSIGKYALTEKTYNGTAYQIGDGFTYQNNGLLANTIDVDEDKAKNVSPQFVQKGYGYLNYKGHAIYGVRCDGSHTWQDNPDVKNVHNNEVGSEDAIYAKTKIYLVDKNNKETCVFDGSKAPTEEGNNLNIDD